MAIDWGKAVRRTYEYYEVDPETWHDARLVDGIVSCTVSRDLSKETLSSAEVSMAAGAIGEGAYLRAYMVVRQGSERRRLPMGTWLVGEPGIETDGVRAVEQAAASSPLKELEDDAPPVFFSVGSGQAAARAAGLASAHCRAPVESPPLSSVLAEPFVASLEDSWLSYVAALAAKDRLSLDVDGLGRIVWLPDASIAPDAPGVVLQDDGDSILCGATSISKAASETYNAVEVVLSEAGRCVVGRAVNDDPGSPISTVRRGRTVLYRETSPDLPDGAGEAEANALARSILAEKSVVERTATVEHRYRPDVALRTVVGVRFARAGLDAAGRVVSQTIPLTPGCRVTSEITCTQTLWRG